MFSVNKEENVIHLKNVCKSYLVKGKQIPLRKPALLLLLEKFP